MLKFLRKYNTVILVVGGCLLMVVFLLPQALTEMGRGGFGSTYARVGSEKVTASAMSEAVRELNVAKALMPEVVGIFQVTGPEHWYLLRREAERAGLIGGSQDARTMIEEYGPQFYAEVMLSQDISNNYPQQFLAQRRQLHLRDGVEVMRQRRQFMIEGGGNEQAADEALAVAAGIIRMMQLYDSSDVMPRQQALNIARRIHDTVVAQAVIIPPESIGAILDTATAERIEAHFEQYKDVRPAENEFGIGYMRPRAVQLEWILLSNEQVSTNLVLDEIEVNKFWRQARQQNASRYAADFAAAREAVERDFRRMKVGEVMQKVEEFVRAELLISRRGLADDGRYKVLPDDWTDRRLKINVLADRISEMLERQFGLSGVRPEVVSGGGSWLSRDEIMALPELGRAGIQVTQELRAPVADFALNAREIGGIDRVPVQVGLIYGPAITALQDRVWFRILDARSESPPESVAEVRARAIENIRLLDAMDYFEREKDNYRRDLAVELREQFTVNIPDARWQSVEITGESVIDVASGMPVPELNTEAFRNAVLNIVSSWDPKLGAESFDPDEKTFAMVVPSARALVVTQVRQRRPLTLEQYRAAGRTISSAASQEFRMNAQDGPFSYTRLAERLNFRVIERGDSAAREEELEQTETE